MSKIWLPGGGGGTDLDVVTAGSGDILAGKVIVGPDGEPLTGTLALTGTAADSQVLAGQTYYNTDAKTKRTGSMVNRGAVSQSLGINGSYTIPAGYHNGSGKVTQSIPTRGAATITPGTANQTAISAGYYASGNVIVAGSANLVPGNIRKGVNIFGKVGTFEGSAVNPFYLIKDGGFDATYGEKVVQYESQDVTAYFDSVTDGTSCYISVSSSPSNGYAIFRLSKPFVLTQYSTLIAKVSYSTDSTAAGEYESKIGVSTNGALTSPSFNASLSVAKDLSKGEVSLNVASLSGYYYIYAYVKADYRDYGRLSIFNLYFR